MDDRSLAAVIDAAWEKHDGITPATKGEIREAVEAAMEGLDRGTYRVAAPEAGQWTTHQWLKKALLLYFRLRDSEPIEAGCRAYDKVALKFEGWGANRFREAGFRVVPGAVVRRSAYIAPGVVVMPSFINAGARVESGTMVDTWVTVGSCAQIGRNCHLSGGVGIGGVFEPLQANPVIIEDDCFIGARSEVVEALI